MTERDEFTAALLKAYLSAEEAYEARENFYELMVRAVARVAMERAAEVLNGWKKDLELEGDYSTWPNLVADEIRALLVDADSESTNGDAT